MERYDKQKRCVVVCAGSVTPWDVKLCAVTDSDYIIAADAGMHRAKQMGITPHLIVGDFDSADLPKSCDIPIERHPSHKNDTDCLLALRRGLEMGCGSFVILGGLGGRLDHTIANIQSLRFLLERGCEGMLIGEKTTLRLLQNGSITLPPTEGYLSVFAMEGRCVGVCERGLEYNIEDATLSTAFPLGVSNRFVDGQTATIEVRDGLLIVMTVIED